MAAADPWVEFLAAVNLAIAAGLLVALVAARAGSGGPIATAVRRLSIPRRREIGVFAAGVLAGAMIAAALLVGHSAASAPVAGESAARLDRLDKAVADLQATIAADFLAEHNRLDASDAGLKQILARIEATIKKPQPGPPPAPASSAKVSLYWAGVETKAQGMAVVWVALQNLGATPALIRAADISFCTLRDDKVDQGDCVAAPANDPQCGRTLVCEKDMLMIQGVGGEKIRYATVPRLRRFARNAPFGIMLKVKCDDGAGHACEIGRLSAICRNGNGGDARKACDIATDADPAPSPAPAASNSAPDQSAPVNR